MRSSLLLLLVLISAGAAEAGDKPGKRPVEKDVSNEKLRLETICDRYTPQTEEGKKLYQEMKAVGRHQNTFMREQIGMMLEYVDKNLESKVNEVGKRCVELWAAKFIQWDDRSRAHRAIDSMKTALISKKIFSEKAETLNGLEAILKTDPKDLKTEYLDVLKGNGTEIPERIKDLQNPLLEKMVSTIARELPKKEADGFNKELNGWSGGVDNLGIIIKKYSEKVDPDALRKGMGIPGEKDIDPVTYLRALLGV